jgi:diacylglycerol kinase (ATP)
MAGGRADKPKRKRAAAKAATAVPNEGLGRIWRAFLNSMRGLREGLLTESAIRQEMAIAALGLVLSFFVARDVWTWVALVASMLLVLSVEFLNTAIERLCDRVHPDRHEAIRITKDLASAGVFFTLVLCGMVWLVALWMRFAA